MIIITNGNDPAEGNNQKAFAVGSGTGTGSGHNSPCRLAGRRGEPFRIFAAHRSPLWGSRSGGEANRGREVPPGGHSIDCLPNAAAPAALQTDVLSSLRLIARQLPSLPSIVQVSPGQGTPPRRGEPGYRDAGAGRFILRSFIIPRRWYMVISFVAVCFRGDEGERAPVDDRGRRGTRAQGTFLQILFYSPFGATSSIAAIVPYR
jgi:hypothetical protein